MKSVETFSADFCMHFYIFVFSFVKVSYKIIEKYKRGAGKHKKIGKIVKIHIWGIRQRDVCFFETKMECYFENGIKKENVIVCNGNIRYWNVHFGGGI